MSASRLAEELPWLPAPPALQDLAWLPPEADLTGCRGLTSLRLGAFGAYGPFCNGKMAISLVLAPDLRSSPPVSI